MAVKTSKNIQLQDKVTFNIPAIAENYIEISDPDSELPEIFSKEDDEMLRLPIYILGEGSNTVFLKNFDGTIISIENKDIRVISEDERSVLAEVDAGMIWIDFVDYALKSGWGQLENLSYIPGTVGASPVQNIGAYGLELDEVIDSVYGFNIETSKFVWMSKNECKFSYRNSIFKSELKNKFIITKVRFKLAKQGYYDLRLDYLDVKNKISEKKLDPASITAQQLSEIIIEIRTHKLPDWKKIGTAGSFFQNPVVTKDKYKELLENYPELPSYNLPSIDERFVSHLKIPAAWLIDKAGWKGKEYKSDEYHYGVSPRQALVLINYQGQTGEQLKSLMTKIQKDIKDKYEIELIPEVNLID